MRIQTIAVVSWLFVVMGVSGTWPSTAFAQQEESETTRKVPVEYLRIQNETLESQTNEKAPATKRLIWTGPGGDVQGILFEGEENVPDDEHMETWVSRALSIYAQTDDQESREKQREEIVKGLNTIFDLRHQQRVKELRELEARVQKLKATLEQRAASKSEIVKKRLDYLIREADGLGWGDGIPAPKRSGPTGVGFSADILPNQPVTEVSTEEVTATKKLP